jgi:hypothetical protein
VYYPESGLWSRLDEADWKQPLNESSVGHSLSEVIPDIFQSWAGRVNKILVPVRACHFTPASHHAFFVSMGVDNETRGPKTFSGKPQIIQLVGFYEYQRGRS